MSSYRVWCDSCDVEAVVNAISFARGSVVQHREEKECEDMEYEEV